MEGNNGKTCVFNSFNKGNNLKYLKCSGLSKNKKDKKIEALFFSISYSLSILISTLVFFFKDNAFHLFLSHIFIIFFILEL